MQRRSDIDIGQLVAGDRMTISRLISAVENEAESSGALLKTVYLHTGKAYRIGITGPPGAGKSTITNRLVRFYRKQNLTVGIIAVDPTSPFTGGALLGDRVRMTDAELDGGVFIRSMASRGSLGGLSKKAIEAADILDAAGMDIVMMETVGVGQSELDIAGAADTTIVVLVPESGDSIQAMKAGLMEIADIFVMNKADRAGADQAVMSINMILSMRKWFDWVPAVIKAVASEGIGTEEIAGRIRNHEEFLRTSGVLGEKRKKRVEDRIRMLVADRLRIGFWAPERERILMEKTTAVANMESTPYDVAEELVNHFRNE